MDVAVSKSVRPGPDAVHVTTSTAKVHSLGTDNTVKVRFRDIDGNCSNSLVLDNWLRDDFEEGCTDNFSISNIGNNIGEISSMDIWREGIIDDSLYLNTAFVKRINTGFETIFPIHRLIPKNDPLCVTAYDSFLPVKDPHPEVRSEELKLKRQYYDLVEVVPGLPMQCTEIPDEQVFSTAYQSDIKSRKRKLFAVSKLKMVLAGCKFKTLDDVKALYTTNTLPLPEAAKNKWYLSDEYFAEQRLSGCNPLQIELCTSIPNKFGVTSEMVEPFLEGKTLDQAIIENKIFLTDYVLLSTIEISKKKLSLMAPFGLFYLNNEGVLLPIAIQLKQEKSDTNPVFLPNDPFYTWVMVKIWFNHSDSAVHQAKCHLGFTHLIMESICIVTHRQLSPSHPIYKLLGPHFMFLVAINHRALQVLVAPQGWIDDTMTIGRLGVFDIVRKTFATWKMNIHGTPPEEIKVRQVGPDILPHYPYRDDALPLYDIIKEYVSNIVHGSYDSEDVLLKDFELQGWISEMVKSTSDGGAGIKGVPGADGELKDTDGLITIVSSIIFTCSVQHAAVNFNQYEQYAFPPTYPAFLSGEAPTTKAPLTELDIVKSLANRMMITDTMLVTRLLSERTTQSLGDFEVQYAYDKVATVAHAKFREDLKVESKNFIERNNKRKYPYTVMNPMEIPNAISI